ncbi:MAG: hypothetical protein K0R44_1 [Thermomicrobiales bacterium]|jgi:hypothetical protein|nr:hypothetical protein [Thermomicrobiales bacterium]MDF3014776.1 hypothetical protein [Thermomicrobiales bacterium]
MARNRETADKVTEILELPEGRWVDVRVELETDEPAVAVVRLLLSSAQLHALVDACTEVV